MASADDNLMPPPPDPVEEVQLSIHDVVRTNTILRLHRQYGSEVIAQTFDMSRYCQTRNHKVFDAIHTLASVRMALPYHQRLIWSVAQRVPVSPESNEPLKVPVFAECKAARTRFANAIGQLFHAPDEPCDPNHYNISWSILAEALATTAHLAVNAMENNNETRLNEYMEWLELIFKSYGVEKWVEENGGWNAMIAEAEALKKPKQRQEPCQPGTSAGSNQKDEALR